MMSQDAKYLELLDVLLLLPRVMEITGGCRSKIYLGIHSGAFPAPVKCGATSRWRLSEVNAWVAARIADRDAKRGA